MIRTILTLLLLTTIGQAALAGDWPESFPQEGECVVCARRGAAHGAEKLVDWREHGAKYYGFCSESCAEAFDQMPDGYAEPVLPHEAPTFSWSTTDGESIAGTGHTALLVDFWATWCAPCIQTMPALEELAGEFEDAGLRVVGVSIDEERGKLDAFLERRPVGYPIVHDGGDDPAWWQFQVPAIPAAFLIDAEGQVIAQWSGELDLDEVRAEIEKLVSAD